jgi:hypothetical protein
MKAASKLHLKTYILIFFLVIFAPTGNVLLRKGMEGIRDVGLHSAADLISVGIQVFTSPFIWLGIFFLLLFSSRICSFCPGQTTVSFSRPPRHHLAWWPCWGTLC